MEQMYVAKTLVGSHWKKNFKMNEETLMGMMW